METLALIAALVAVAAATWIIFRGTRTLSARVGERAAEAIARRRSAEATTPAHDATATRGVGARAGEADETIEVNRAGVGLAVAGALLMLVATFLPQLESPFGPIAENSFAQSGFWWFAGLAVITVAATYRVFQQGRRSYFVLVVGLVAVVLAVFAGTGNRLELVDPITDVEIGERASPGIGVYAAGIGGALVAYGGALLAGWSIWPGGRQAPAKRTKRCPDCAETILADAQVCRHCGFRFGGGSPTSPGAG